MAELLTPGNNVPNLSGKDQSGKTIKLNDYKNDRLVLYFYPKDDTPGCTVEACNLRDNYADLLSKGIKVLGVSVDDEKSHQKFINKFNLPFPLIADTDHAFVEGFGVWGQKSMFGKTFMGTKRVTYLIEKGVVSHVIKKVNTKEHTQQILDLLES